MTPLKQHASKPTEMRGGKVAFGHVRVKVNKASATKIGIEDCARITSSRKHSFRIDLRDSWVDRKVKQTKQVSSLANNRGPR